MLATLVVFAHPDDEAIALGARFARFGEAYWVHVTDGAPTNGDDSRAHGFASLADYRAARRHEFAAALATAGIPGAARESLGIPDQQASLRLAELTLRLLSVMKEHQPEVVLTHPYEGGHPDHDACAFAVQHAIALLPRTSGRVPIAIEAPFYHLENGGMVTGSFLPTSEPCEEIAYPLSPQEQERKAAIFACYGSQSQVLQNFPCGTERFRLAPHYDFRKPPHPAPVFYDQFPWGMTSARFSQLASEAEEALAETALALCL